MPTLIREVTSTDFQIVAPADGSDYHLGVIGSSDVVHIDLPLISTVTLGQRFTVACQDGGASTYPISVRRQSPDLIQGATSFTINIGYGTATFVSNGRQYVVDNSSVPRVLGIEAGGTGAVTPEGAVDNLGLDVKEPVTVSAKENINLSAIPNVVNGVTLEVGNSVNLWLQTDATENGIYTVVTVGTGSDGVWARRADFNTASEIRAGVRFLSLQGNSFSNVTFIVLSGEPEIGVDDIIIQPQNNADPVVDAYGNTVFAYSYSANDVNHLRAEATPAGNAARLRAWSDTETHVSGSLDNKGLGRWYGLQVLEIKDTTELTTAGNENYNVYAIAGGLIRRDPNGANRNDTLPSASSIIAHLKNSFARVSFKVTIVNIADADETIQLVSNTGITLHGACEIKQGESREFLFYIEDTAAMGSSDAISVYDLFDVSSGGSSVTFGDGLTETGGTVTVNVSNELQLVGGQVYLRAVPALRLQEYIYNKTGSTVVSGTGVRLVSNSDGTPGIIVADSLSNIEATHVVGGLDIADNAAGYIVKAVTFGSLNTSAAPLAGSPIYLDTLGGFTYTPPTNANSIQQIIGYVMVKDASAGVITFCPQPPIKFGTSFLQNESVTAAKIDPAVTFSLTYTQELIMSVTEKKLHTESTSNPVQTGATLLQATSGATATVTAFVSGGQNRFTVTSVTGVFDTTNLVTGTNPDTSTFTFTPSETLLDCWELTATPAAFSTIASMSGPLQQTVDGLGLATGQCRYIAENNQIETLSSDAYPVIGAEFCPSTTSSHA